MTFSKLCLALCAVCCTLAGTTAAALQWPSDLVAVNPGKSLQAMPAGIDMSAESAAPMDENAYGHDASDSHSAAVKSRDQIMSAESRHAATVPVSVPLSLLVAARPGLRTVLTVQEPTVAHVGELVQHVPSAISHQSQTIVHDHRRLVTPIVAPALRTTQLVRQQQPAVWTLGEPRMFVLNH